MTLATPALPFGRLGLFASSDSRPRYSSRTLDLVASANVIDMLGLLTLDWDKLYAWQRDPRKFREADFRTLQASGVNVFHPAVDPNVGDADAGDAAYRASRGWITSWNRLLTAHPKYFLRILQAADLDRAHQDGKIGILVGFQNSDHFRTVSDVALFHRLGQRVSQLTYNARNRIGTGCKETLDSGLSQFGAEIVQAMNQAGMAIDLSHCSDRTTRETIELSRVPVLVTHSNCRALAPHPRCKSDESIRALAARGGVMGITVLPAFVRPGGEATVENILDHFDHVVRLVGIEHVGLGSDSDLDAVDPKTGQVRARYRVKGLQNARRVFDLVEGLTRRGYTDDHVRLVLGGNFRRVLADIWQGSVVPAPVVPAPAAPATAASTAAAG